MHVIQEHDLLLEEESYLFSPNPKFTENVRKPSLPKILPRPPPTPDMSFDGENPWQEILSPASRQKRSMDVVSVSSILKKTELQPYSNQGETYTTKDFYKSVSVQNKVRFLCSLDINSHYEQYLYQLKHFKLKKRLLTKFVSILNNQQIEKMKGEIKRSEELLNQFANYNFQQGETRKSEVLVTNKNEKKRQEIRENENKILTNLRKKGVINVGDRASASVLPEKKVVTINRRTGEISNIIPKNIISLLELQRSKSKISEGENQIIRNLQKKGIIQEVGGSYFLSAKQTMTVIDQKDPLSFDDDEEEEEVSREDKNMPSESLDPLAVIKLNIPVEEIIESNHIVDIESVRDLD